MRLSVAFENTKDTNTVRGPVQVGWFLNEKKGGIIYAAPERVRSVEANREHAKSASRCPAVIKMESRYFMVKCPFDIHIGFARDKDGKGVLRNLAFVPASWVISFTSRTRLNGVPKVSRLSSCLSHLPLLSGYDEQQILS